MRVSPKPVIGPIAELSEPSEYLQEVLATPPRWIIRWGQVGVFVLVMVLLTLGWFIRYPDRISGKLIITAASPPVGIVAQTDGYIMDLLVADHDTVKAGEILAVIQNPARFEDVIQLKHNLQSLAARNLKEVALDSLIFPPLQLGSLQENYTKLQEAWSAYGQYQRLNPHYQERLSIERQLAQYQKYFTQKQVEQELLYRKSQLVEKDFLRNKQLYATQSIAERALEVSEESWLEAKYAAESVSSELSQIQLSISQLLHKQQQSNIQHHQTETLLQNTLQSAIDNQLAVLRHWEEHYVLKAPHDGRVSFFEIESSKQYVHALDTVMRIVSKSNQPIFGRLLVPIKNFGKIKVGQKVQVYLDNYPYEEYGTLAAKVEDFSELPQQDKYRVTISFPEGLRTQYGKTISAQQHLQGRADIITEESRLLERLFDKLRAQTQ